MRAVILETIIAALLPIDWVLALWQGGSAAHGYTDEWSDIDIAVIVEDYRVQDTFDILEQSLKTISEIQFKWRVPEPAWHGHSQCFYQLEGVNPFLQIDFAVLKRSSRNDFLEVERHGNVVVGFDKANLVTPPALDKIKHLQEMQARLAILKNNFDFLQIFVKKELNRGNLVAAISNYHSHTLNPLIEVLGMLYRPNRYDFETKYFNRDFPVEVIDQVENLYCLSSLDDLAKKQQEAELLFAETVKKVEASFPLGL
ncbi:nucleotidyltransferase domain-containing protein [Microcoleus sp. FACHB-672]|nr:nucleotidyltransferase domain-containing protein [Microcoleus sp. FACHB-672]